MSDLPGGTSGSVLHEYSNNDRGFGRHDAALAAFLGARGLGHDFIAVGQTARSAAGPRATKLSRFTISRMFVSIICAMVPRMPICIWVTG
jgi:hypothetical protein